MRVIVATFLSVICCLTSSFGTVLNAPDWSLPSLSGQILHLTDYRSKVVLLVFWATWCPDCRNELPTLIDLQNACGSKKFSVIGISIDTGSVGDISNFVSANHINYPVVLSDDATKRAYGGVRAIPAIFLINVNGNVVQKWTETGTAISEPDLKQAIEPLLASITQVQAPAITASSSSDSPQPVPAPSTMIAETAYPQSGGFLRQFKGSNPKEHYSLTLDQENYYVYIPDNYDGSEPFGLLAFIDASDSIQLPTGWDQILKDRKLIYVAAQNVGNKQSMKRRSDVTMDGVVQMEKSYKIDPARVYLSGISGGARMSVFTSFHYPDFFTGIIPICGADYFRPVPKVAATKDDAYGVNSYDSFLLPVAKQKLRIALITGEKDWRRGNILDIYNGAYVKDGFNVKLWDVPGMGHEICSPEILGQAIDYIEKKSDSSPAAAAPQS